MEDIRFVLEAPHVNKVQKKRPRLVTSCDNCRLKKIKCIQSAPDTVCEACTNARIPCRFRDRERYFAERSRAAAGAAALSQGDASKRSQLRSLEPNAKVSAPKTPVDSAHGSVVRSTAQRTHPYHPYLSLAAKDGLPSTSSPSPAPSETSSATPPLLNPPFDPREPDRPHSALMMTFIEAFFDNLNIYFPFLAYDETIRHFFGHSLSALMANCIAALATKHTDLPEVHSRGVLYVTDLYIDKAKALLAPIVNIPSLETLHSLILLAWAEQKRDRITQFCQFGQMAMQMAFELRLNDENVIWGLAQTEYERNSLRHTWASATQLDASVKSQTYSSVLV